MSDELAYEAGRAVNSEPPERRRVEACPFEVGTSERAAWLRGFAEAHAEAAPPVDLEKQLAEAIRLEDSHGSR